MSVTNLPDPKDARIAVIGLGYVGLPLAVEFAKTRTVVGFDISATRLQELEAGEDRTREVTREELRAAKGLRFSGSVSDLAGCNTYIITVPTPVDRSRRPDLGPLIAASGTVGTVLSPGNVVIYESTVYPGATEEECVPLLARQSGLVFNQDFFVGYSPERINPGDPHRRLPSILKVTSGSTPEAADFVDELYRSIISAGTYKAESIRVAEAAKVIENTQRDLNVALVNELAIIFNRMRIDTTAVLRAAGTKWNFLPFSPGLVGGHCIGVDPYYLTHKAEQLGYHPQIILAGRRLNDGMGAYVAGQMLKSMVRRRIQVDGARVLVMGLTFKENCPDIRNTKVIDLVDGLKDFGVEVDVYDPLCDPEEARVELGIAPIESPATGAYDGIIVAVAHDDFRDMGVSAIRSFGKPGAVLYDLKSIFPASDSDARL